MIFRVRLFPVAILTLFVLILASCRSSRFLEEDQYLVKDVKLNGIDLHLKENAELFVAQDIKPNSAFNLFIYNLFNTKKGRYKTSGIRNVGQPPHLLDSTLVDVSGNQIKKYLFSKGYFDAQVVPVINAKNKKATIDFNIIQGTPYTIKDIRYEFDDDRIKKLYHEDIIPVSDVKPGVQYDALLLTEDRERLYLDLRNHGYYDFLRQYMHVGVDSTLGHHQLALNIKIDNPSDSTLHQQYHINHVALNIHKDDGPVSKFKFDRENQDSISGIYFTDKTKSFRLRPVQRYMYLKSGDVFSLENENKSYDRLYEMNGFRSVKINYQKVDSNLLDVNYELIPRKKMSNQIEGEYTFSSGMQGFNIGNTFSHHNIFGGAEQLEVKFRYGMLFDARIPGNLADKIFNNDFQIGVNLVFPRILAPFHVNPSGNYGLPRTTLSTNLQVFDQDQTYSNRYYTTTLNYSWYETEYKYHSLTPIVLEYRLGRLNSNFAQSLIDKGYLLYVASNNREYFGLGSQYSYIYNAKMLMKKENFHYFRGSIDVSGNLLDLLGKVVHLPATNEGEKKILGVPFIQYAKAEVDYRWYRSFGGNRQLVLRVNPGIVIPYGNNTNLLIFEKSFYSGGMNGIRAWQARTLGPGSYNREILDESLRLNMRNLDQLGEIKLEGNAEYRFRIAQSFLGAKLNGATFVDMGNVWRLKQNDLNPGGEFKVDKFLGQIAVGTGFGLRFDSDYFIIRFDAGLKVKDPQFKGADQWVIKHLFHPTDFRENYYQTHRPDRYNFIQYNFGIGMPF